MHKYSNRNRRVSSPLSPIFSLLLEPSGKLFKKLQDLLAEDEQAQKITPPIIQHQRPVYGFPSSWLLFPLIVSLVSKPLRSRLSDQVTMMVNQVMMERNHTARAKKPGIWSPRFRMADGVATCAWEERISAQRCRWL